MERELQAFSLMHEELDAVWTEMYRVLKDGAFLCINIGDAVRTIDDKFQLFSNHSRILSFCTSIGFDALPVILWRKQTNAPNKFMGSGMLPAGAYITLEHEFVLVFRKGGKRCFDSPSEKMARQESAYFWEERNKWFSDIWDFKGTTQKLNNDKVRKRSGAFPLELAYRMINMYSVRGDTVLDPFLGTGTTILAAMAACRNSIGVELDKEFKDVISGSGPELPIISQRPDIRADRIAPGFYRGMPGTGKKPEICERPSWISGYDPAGNQHDTL